MVITDYPNYTDFENYVKNNFVIDFTGTAWKVSKYGVFSGRYFPVFGLNTEIYGVDLHIPSEYRKIWTRKNSAFGFFSRSVTALITKTTWKIVLLLTTLTTLILTIREKKFHHRLHCQRWYGRLLLIMHSSLATLILKSKWKIVITDYIDSPDLHITITYTGMHRY